MVERSNSGVVTIRSNIVFDGDRWDLVPGELLRHWRRQTRPTRLQHDESMYYEPCSVCRRPIVEINLKGCTECPHAPHPDRVASASAQHQQTVADAVEREVAENEKLLNGATGDSSGDPDA